MERGTRRLRAVAAGVVAAAVVFRGAVSWAQPALGPEHGIGEAEDGPVSHFSPADVASGGGVQLAAWTDARGLMVTRFGPDGARLGPARGVVIDPHAGIGRGQARARFDGQRFVLAWVLPRSSPDAGRLRVQRVTAEGVASGAPITLGSPASDDFDLDCEAASGTCALAWIEPRVPGSESGSVRVTRFTRDERVLDPDGVTVSDRETCSRASVAARPEGILVAYYNNSATPLASWAQNFRALSLDGEARLGDERNAGYVSYGALRVYAAGDAFVAVYGQLPYLATQLVPIARRLDLAGAFVGDAVALDATVLPAFSSPPPALAVLRDGAGATRLRFAWPSVAAPAGLRVRDYSPALAPLGPARATAVRARQVGLSTDGRFVVAHQSDGYYTSLGSRLDADGGAVTSPMHRIALAAPEQLHPALTFDGDTYFAAWWEQRGTHGNVDGPTLYGARLARDGAALDPRGLALSAPQSAPCSPPVIAASGGWRLVAWHLEGDAAQGAEGVYVQAVDPAGNAVGDPQRVLRGVRRGDPRDGLDLALAGSPEGFLLAASVIVGSPDTHGDIQVLRFDATGTAQGAAVPVASTRADEVAPAVSYGGGRFLVGWAQQGGGFGAAAVRARFFNHRSGAVDGPELRLGAPASASYPGLSAAYSQGQHALVSVGHDGAARGYRVFADGAVRDGAITFPGATAPAMLGRATLAGVGDHWLLGTLDYVSTVATVRALSPGLAAATAPVEIARGLDYDLILGYATALASDGSPDALAAYTQVVQDGPSRSLRVRVRRLVGDRAWPCGTGDGALRCCAADSDCDDRDASTDDRCVEARCEHAARDAGADPPPDAPRDAPTDAPHDASTDAPRDAPADAAAMPSPSPACGCRSAPSAPPRGLALLALLLLGRRARRQRRAAL